MEKLTKPVWYLTKDGDRSCIRLYERHYSCYHYKDGRKRTQFVGPGESIVLRTDVADALFVWRKFIDDSGQTGVNCAVFRNEGPYLSSELIRQADSIADTVWPCERHYTFVRSEAVRSANPGYCFIRAGWKRCGKTGGGLTILERAPALTRTIAGQQEGTPMPQGPGKYDDLCTEAREAAGADTAVLIIVNGSKGSGFSVQTISRLQSRGLPALLRILADDIERVQ